MITALTRAVLLVLLTIATFSANAQQQKSSKTKVGIVFEMPDARYADQFRDEAIPELKQATTAAIARALAEKVRFLDFVANSGVNYLLTARLDRAEGSPASGPAEFGIHLMLSGGQVQDDVSHYIVFRTKDQYLSAVGDQDALVREIEQAIERADRTELVRSLLSHVVIADKGKLNRQPFGWIVHGDRKALCMNPDSLLQIVNAFPAYGSTVREKFTARVLDIDSPDAGIVSVPIKDAPLEMIQQLRALDPRDVRVERVFMLEYRHYCPPQEVPAAAVSFDPGENP